MFALYILGMDCSHVGIAAKITDIQREESYYPVHVHCSDKPGIVHLHARHSMHHNQATPFRVYCWTVEEKRQEALDQARPPIAAVGRVQTRQNSTRFCGVK